MNKFEQVLSDGHQMSLAGGWGEAGRVPSPARSHVWWGSYPVRYNASWEMVTSPMDRQTHTSENISFPLLCLWAVKIV